MNLYQPILLKKTKSSTWEKGWKRTNASGETFLEEDRKRKVEQVFKYKVNWFREVCNE
ncbi:hypothetical protein [Clostridium magnum]|uniref:Uncharacterized protein n=1 Tax=Clostridium magnum DSM 2767 TaxID=1121326 RepID=A0A162UXJ1_9CLOT|nr:hypothetical protein [Clostridium magnum]KZL94387.1 hypothetical protein CLMAG_14400 [Clostridium magnum DSM 2767]SHJ59387.1 hypothetical protein SAMN02745944_06203 [Clostridium magnum DSM 2767]